MTRGSKAPTFTTQPKRCTFCGQMKDDVIWLHPACDLGVNCKSIVRRINDRRSGYHEHEEWACGDCRQQRFVWP